ISERDLALIRTDARLDADTAPLTLETVSTLYRYTVLGRALKLRIADFLSLKILFGIDPFASPDATLHFAALTGKLRDSGFTIPQLNYVYRHLSEPPGDLAPQQTTLLLLARTLRDGLTRIAQDNTRAPDPAGELTRAKLALLFDNTIVDQTIGMISG